MKLIFTNRMKIVKLLRLPLLITVMAFLYVAGSGFLAAQTTGDYRSANGGNWSTLSTWQRYNGTNWVTPTTAQGYPGQNTGTGTVTIRDDDDITLDVSPANAIGALNVGVSNDNRSPTLTFSGTNALSVSGNVTIFATSGNRDKIISVNAGILTIGGNLRIGTGGQGGDNDNRQSILNLTTGTVTVSGNLTLETRSGGNGANGQAQLNITGAGTFNLAGSFTTPNSFGTLNMTAGTFNYNGTSAQTIRIDDATNDLTYYNITVNNTSGSGATLSAAITAANVTNNISVGNISSGSLFNTGNYNITLGATKTLTVAANSTMNAGTSVITFGTSGNMTINGTFRTANTNGFSGATNTAINSTNTPTITLGANSTVDYNAAANQTVTGRTYGGNLSFSGSGTKTADGAITVNGKTIINGVTFSSGSGSGYSSTMGSLEMTASSAISLGTGNHTLTFSTSSGETWTGTLTINGWQGSYNGTSGTAGKIKFGTNTSGLTSAQLSQMRFFDGTSYYRAVILTDGEVVPDGNIITTGTINGSPFCQGESGITVPFTYDLPEGFPNGTTTFTAQLSNASGSFASPTNLQSVASDESGSQSISVTIPGGTPAGTGYRIRVVSNTPAVTGSANTVDLEVNALPTVSITGSTAICVGETTTLSPTTGGTWASSDNGVATVTDAGVVTAQSAGTATFTFTETATGCSNTTSSVTVNALPADPGNPTSDSPQCASVGVTLTRTGTPPAGVTWYWQTSPSGTNTDNSGATYNVTSSGTYYIRARDNTTLCWSSGAGSATVVVNPLPTIVLGTSPTVCLGTTSANLPVTLTTNNPTEYTIDFDASAEAEGFADVITFTTLTNPIVLTIPAGPAVGTYNGTITVRNANGCVSASAVAFTVTITEINVTTAITQPNCYLQGKILLTVTGGTAPYIYNWSDLPGTNNPKDRTGLEDGTYTVTITDNNGCTFVSGPHTLTNPDAPCLGSTVCSTDGAYIFSTDPDPENTNYTWRIEDLSDNSDESAWITGGQGTSTVTIDWTSATDGNYLVCVVASNTCGSTTEICKTVYVNSAVAAASSNTVCEGGDLQLFASGGDSYVWSGPNGFSSSSANPTIYNVSSANAGLYTVTVTTSRGCQATANVTVTLDTPPSLSGAVTDATCFQSNGAIDLTVTPAGVYTYLWSNGATTEDISNIPSGNYTVTVTNAGGCEEIMTFSVNNLDGPSISASVTNIACYGGSTGAINVTVAGGTAPYTYSWSNGSTTEDLSSLSAGDYLLTVTDATGCQAFYNVTLTEPYPLNLDYTKVDVLCNGGTTGSINLIVTGGAGGYSYSWKKDGNPYSTNEDLTLLGAGVYEVTVTDANSCTATLSVTITEPAAALAATATADPMVSCFGGSDGYIGLSVTGGTEPYTYLWSGPGGFTSINKNIQNLSAGTYNVIITDANGCTFATNATVTEPAAALAISSHTEVNVSCNGGNDGSIDIEITGGTSPYTYAWSNGASTQDLTGLATGSYTVIVTDAKGCTTTGTYNITEPAVLSASISKTDVDCYGASTGSIDLTITGGTAPYTILWSNLSTNEDLSNIPAGYYSVLITDDNGCEYTTNTVLTQPIDILITGSVTNVLCNGASTGAIDITVSGGTGGYTYSWNDGPTSEDRTGLAANTYIVTVTDGNSCQKQASFTIAEPSAISLATVISNISCNGGSDGSINLTVSGGVGPYTFAWSTGATTEDIDGLSSGTFDVTVTDANLCTATLTNLIITEPAVLTLSVTKNNDVTCKGGDDGSATVTPTGGTAPYSYLWSNGSTAQTPVNFAAGTYTVVVTDSKGCTANGSISISQPATEIELYTSIKNDNACGNPASGAIDLIVVNGTAPFTYAWSNGAVTEDISGLTAGTYDVTVTDANLCSATLTGITVGTAAALTVSVEAFDRTCLAADGSAFAVVSGGTPPYTYVWSTSATTSSITGLDVNTYSVTVTDADGCTANGSGAVGSPSCAPPVAVDDYAITLGETPVYGNVSFNDSDADHSIGELEFLPLDIPAPEVGVLNWSGSYDGSFIFTPAAGFSGTVTIRYIVEDPTGLQDEGLLTIYVYGVPIAVDDVNSTYTDTPVQGNVLINDWDPKDRPLTATPETKTTANGGTVVISSNGNYIYTPPTGYTGEDTFTYTVCDDNVPPSCNSATVTIEVLPQPTSGNDAPIAVNDAYQMTVNTTLNGTVLANDFDIDGDALTVTSGTADTDGDGNPDVLTIATPTNVYGTNVNGDVVVAGQLTLNSDGTFAFVSEPNFTGTVEIGYVNSDGTLTDDARLVILVLPTQNLTNTTFAINDSKSTEKETDISGNVLDNDFDLEGHNQSVSSPGTYATTNGSITIFANGDYTYSPNTGFTGQDTYTYTVCDDGTPQACDQGTIIIDVYEITANNDPPIAISDAYIGNGNTTVSGSVLDNDFDNDGNLNPNSVSLVGPAPNPLTEGTLTLNTDGTFSFVPVPGFSGDVTFRYEVCDTDGTPLCDEADVTITILAINSTFATDDIYYLNEDGSLNGNVLTNDNDPEGNTQTVTLVTGPTHGTLTLNANGTFTFEPNPNYNGTDKFVYQVCDNGTPQACDNATVYLNVLGVNDPPVAVNDINTTFKNTATTGNVLTNDSDPEGDNLVVTVQTGAPTTAGGTVTVNADGSYSYTPPSNYFGEDTFTYQVCDDGTPVECSNTTVTIEVLDRATALNDAPIAVNDYYQGTLDFNVTGNVLANDMDPDANPLVVNSSLIDSDGDGSVDDVLTVGTPTQVYGKDNSGNDVLAGTLTLNSNGTFTFDPETGFIGQVTYTYEACDNGTPALCDNATATIDMLANPGAGNTVFALNDVVSTAINTAATGNVLTNDYDPQGNPMTITNVGTFATANGSITIAADGSYTYTPNTGFTGSDSYTYTVCDNGTPQACDNATLTISVYENTGGNDAPVAQNDAFYTGKNSTLSGNVILNDSDPDGNLDANSVTLVSGGSAVSNGTLTLNANGTFTYEPNEGFTGSVFFTYQVCDTDGTPLCDQATVFIDVMGGNTTYAVDDSYLGIDVVSMTGNVLNNDYDPEGDNQSVTLVTGVSYGTLILNTDGTFTYTPNTNFKGTDMFIYKVCDDGNPSVCDYATVYLNVGKRTKSCLISNENIHSK